MIPLIAQMKRLSAKAKSRTKNSKVTQAVTSLVARQKARINHRRRNRLSLTNRISENYANVGYKCSF
ncbi:MAG: hypothetical protein COB54_01655 [Alphaproteobacteria bacterium]|nr:MAG: hypothetical protein COB54_01655 [Alphaproteobacteria bacterium]